MRKPIFDDLVIGEEEVVVASAVFADVTIVDDEARFEAALVKGTIEFTASASHSTATVVRSDGHFIVAGNNGTEVTVENGDYSAVLSGSTIVFNDSRGDSHYDITRGSGIIFDRGGADVYNFVTAELDFYSLIGFNPLEDTLIIDGVEQVVTESDAFGNITVILEGEEIFG